jgi:hypothetical protein
MGTRVALKKIMGPRPKKNNGSVCHPKKNNGHARRVFKIRDKMLKMYSE